MPETGGRGAGEGRQNPKGVVDAAEARYRWSYLPGEPDALKGACPVREEVVGDVPKGNALATYFMKVVGEAPTGRSRRLIVTEHGIPYQAKASGERSAHSSRRSHDLLGRTRRSSTGRGGTGGRYSAAMGYAKCEEPDWHCISLAAFGQQA
jgi:hypothetical protein